MSRKPPKKSDMGKSWMKPRRDSRQMISPEYHLIVSEGTKTEPKYFEKIKETIDAKYRDRIHLDISGKGANTVTLFNRAVKDVARSNNVYKHVWLVFDKDDFPPENFDRTAELCASESTDETRYHPIWSNQCIELWFLLHFMFLQQDRKKAILQNFFPSANTTPARPPRAHFRTNYFTFLAPLLRRAGAFLHIFLSLLTTTDFLKCQKWTQKKQ